MNQKHFFLLSQKKKKKTGSVAGDGQFRDTTKSKAMYDETVENDIEKRRAQQSIGSWQTCQP